MTAHQTWRSRGVEEVGVGDGDGSGISGAPICMLKTQERRSTPGPTPRALSHATTQLHLLISAGPFPCYALVLVPRPPGLPEQLWAAAVAAQQSLCVVPEAEGGRWEGIRCLVGSLVADGTTCRLVRYTAKFVISSSFTRSSLLHGLWVHRTPGACASAAISSLATCSRGTFVLPPACPSTLPT